MTERCTTFIIFGSRELPKFGWLVIERAQQETLLLMDDDLDQETALDIYESDTHTLESWSNSGYIGCVLSEVTDKDSRRVYVAPMMHAPTKRVLSYLKKETVDPFTYNVAKDITSV